MYSRDEVRKIVISEMKTFEKELFDRYFRLGSSFIGQLPCVDIENDILAYFILFFLDSYKTIGGKATLNIARQVSSLSGGGLAVSYADSGQSMVSGIFQSNPYGQMFTTMYERCIGRGYKPFTV